MSGLDIRLVEFRYTRTSFETEFNLDRRINFSLVCKRDSDMFRGSIRGSTKEMVTGNVGFNFYLRIVVENDTRPRLILLKSNCYNMFFDISHAQNNKLNPNIVFDESTKKFKCRYRIQGFENMRYQNFYKPLDNFEIKSLENGNIEFICDGSVKLLVRAKRKRYDDDDNSVATMAPMARISKLLTQTDVQADVQPKW